jgi:tetratricopeptide (TPR) repeat protein
MNILIRKKVHNASKIFFYMTVFFLIFLCGPVWSETEGPLKLPRVEGSKSFDLEISQINRLAIKNYQQGLFEKAVEHFKKALNLARQLRAPSQGTLYFNLSLSLHKLGNHEEATKQFYSARRFARGNSKILESALLKMHECGFNPSISCEGKLPLSMNIEGSH